MVAGTGSEVAAPVWVSPGEPVPVQLMNTIWTDRTGSHDSLLRPGHLSQWLQFVALTQRPTAVTADGLATALRLRDSLRRVAALVTEDTRPVAACTASELRLAVQEINAMASTVAGPRLRLRDGVLERDTRSTAAHALAALGDVAAASIELLTGEDAPLLRACYAPGCVLYFIKDHPRREWCSPVCGNRARAARHYDRHYRQTPVDPESG
jgi:predicted RNA-binding Zn ribbon-like protein